MKIKNYANVKESLLELNHLKRKESFRIENPVCERISVIELTFSLETVNSEEYLNEQLNELLEGVDLSCKFFICEPNKKNRNRIRSYKGIVDKQIDKDAYVQKEFSVEEDTTLIAALLDYSKGSSDFVLNSIADSDTSFMIVVFNSSDFRDVKLDSIVDSIDDYNDVCLNYVELFKIIGQDKKVLILRSSGDGIEDFGIQFIYDNNIFKMGELLDMLKVR